MRRLQDWELKLLEESEKESRERMAARPRMPKFDVEVYRAWAKRNQTLMEMGAEHRAQVESAERIKVHQEAAERYRALGDTAAANEAAATVKHLTRLEEIRRETPAAKRALKLIEECQTRWAAEAAERQAAKAKSIAERDLADRGEPDLAERVALLEKKLAMQEKDE